MKSQFSFPQKQMLCEKWREQSEFWNIFYYKSLLLYHKPHSPPICYLAGRHGRDMGNENWKRRTFLRHLYNFSVRFNFICNIRWSFPPGKPALRTQDVSQNHFLSIVVTHWTSENGPREWGAESPSSQPWRTGFSELRNVLYTGGTCSIVLFSYSSL